MYAFLFDYFVFYKNIIKTIISQRSRFTKIECIYVSECVCLCRYACWMYSK